eukprot:scaffold55491_cov66-Cyclotella_meneghiniana.AAC.2
MKTFHAASALIALLSLLPSSTAKKDPNSPHRVFQTTRSKASKAQSDDVSGHPYYDHDLDVSSKAGKTFKELLPKAAKKPKCVESDVDLNDFELMLDFSSMSMSMSMPMSKSGKAAKSVKCHKSPVYEEFNEHEHPTEQRFEDDEHFNEHEYPDEERFDDYDDGYWYLDDGYWYYDYDDDWWNNDADPTAFVTWYVQLMSTCAGVPLDFDSCAVQAVIGLLASVDFDDDSMPTRMLRGVQTARKLQDYDTFEEYGCVVPTEEEINEVIGTSLGWCEDATIEQNELVVELFMNIFMNETCVCGII